MLWPEVSEDPGLDIIWPYPLSRGLSPRLGCRFEPCGVDHVTLVGRQNFLQWPLPAEDMVSGLAAPHALLDGQIGQRLLQSLWREEPLSSGLPVRLLETLHRVSLVGELPCAPLLQVDVAQLEGILRGCELPESRRFGQRAFSSALFCGFEARNTGVAEVVWRLEG